MPKSTPRSEEQTATVQRQMEQFFEATTDAIFFLDREYRFTFLNRRSKELLAPAGDASDILGEVLFEKFPGTVYEDSPYVFNYKRTMEERLPGEFVATYGEPLNFLVRIQTFPLDDGIMVFFRDITAEQAARKELEQKTLEAERQRSEIESIYQTAPIGLALFDLDDYHYVRLNDRQAAFFGLKPEDIVGKTLIQMAPIEGLRELFDQVARGEPVIAYPLEGTLVNAPDEYRYWTVSYFPVRNDDGEIIGVTAASLEITAQKKAELALIQSEKLAAVGRLAASIAHEINNPLEAVTNLLYLAEGSDTLDEAKRFLRQADIELRRMTLITNQTLRFHRQSTNPTEINADQLFDATLGLYHGKILNARITVDTEIRARKSVHGFEGEIRQVLANLIGNAIDAMPSGGHLKLRAREGRLWNTDRPGIVLTIADNGPGINPTARQRIFEPFFTTKGTNGTGLGLWVSHEIVNRHNGRIRLRTSDDPEHHGTVFTVFLPFDAVKREPEDLGL